MHAAVPVAFRVIAHIETVVSLDIPLRLRLILCASRVFLDNRSNTLFPTRAVVPCASMGDPRKDFILANVANLCALNTAGAAAIDALTQTVYGSDDVNRFLDDARYAVTFLPDSSPVSMRIIT